MSPTCLMCSNFMMPKLNHYLTNSSRLTNNDATRMEFNNSFSHPRVISPGAAATAIRGYSGSPAGHHSNLSSADMQHWRESLETGACGLVASNRFRSCVSFCMDLCVSASIYLSFHKYVSSLKCLRLSSLSIVFVSLLSQFSLSLFSLNFLISVFSPLY